MSTVNMDYTKTISVKPNSNASKRNAQEHENRNLEKVTTGTVIAKKRSTRQKFLDNFISEDASNVKNYILTEKLIPTIRETIYDIVIDSFAMVLGIDSRGRRNSNSRVRYEDAYNNRNSRSSYSRQSSTINAYSCDDIILDSKDEAELVLTKLIEIVGDYGNASIADLYQLIGQKAEWTDYDWGWTNLMSSRTERVRDGYILRLPRPKPIN